MSLTFGSQTGIQLFSLAEKLRAGHAKTVVLRSVPDPARNFLILALPTLHTMTSITFHLFNGLDMLSLGHT